MKIFTFTQADSELVGGIIGASLARRADITVSYFNNGDTAIGLDESVADGLVTEVKVQMAQQAALIEDIRRALINVMTSHVVASIPDDNSAARH